MAVVVAVGTVGVVVVVVVVVWVVAYSPEPRVQGGAPLLVRRLLRIGDATMTSAARQRNALVAGGALCSRDRCCRRCWCS